MIVLTEPRGPADRAGLRSAVTAVFRQFRGQTVVAGFRENDKPGDFITAIDGLEVTSWDELLDEIEKHQSGDTIRFTIERGRRTLNVDVRLVED